MAKIVVYNGDTIAPVPFVNIAELTPAMMPTGRGFSTNFDGVATFDGNEFEGNFLRVSAIGYESQTFIYEMLGGGQLSQTNVYLQPVIYGIETAEVVTYKERPAEIAGILFLALVTAVLHDQLRNG